MDVLQELFSLDGKVAVVSGGSRGIGRMITEGFLRAGVRVYITARKAEQLEQATSELSDLGDCVGIAADLSTEAEAQRFAAEVTAREDKLHILVNNAGAAWGEAIDTFPESAWDKVLDINVKGVFHLTRAFLPQLRAAGTADDPARVINIGSIDAIHVPMVENYSYSASKAAVHQLTRHLAKRLGGEHITVNAVAPGPFRSKMMDATLDAFEDAIVATSPLGRIGRPEDMAGVAIYLASRAASYVTGAIIPVDGGIATTK